METKEGFPCISKCPANTVRYWTETVVKQRSLQAIIFIYII